MDGSIVFKDILFAIFLQWISDTLSLKIIEFQTISGW